MDALAGKRPGGPFVFRVERVRLPPGTASSAEARTLARLQVWCGGRNLCAGEDEAGRFEALEVPLVDLAAWLVEGWEARVFDTALPDAIATRFQFGVPLAERWAMSEALALEPGEQDAVFAWASPRALEFAATDYFLPNALFQRVDDYVRVSWAQRVRELPFTRLRFDPARGDALVDVHEFVRACRDVLDKVNAWTAGIEGDPRVDAVRAFLRADPAALGRRAVQRWVQGVDVDRVLSPAELRELGERGQAGAVAAFLRSASGSLTASDVERCLDRFARSTARIDRERLRGLTESLGVDDAIDPARPWESGSGSPGRSVGAWPNSVGVRWPRPYRSSASWHTSALAWNALRSMRRKWMARASWETMDGP